jgi:hypothetical protein
MELIEKSSYEPRDLQYFISSTVTLEHGKGMQIDIEIQGGQGVIQEINAREKIIIPKDTGGVLIPDESPPAGPRTLKICFDDVDEHTLTFRENPSDHRYYLVFREDRQYGEFTEYGGESHRVIFHGEIPHLYVRLDERIDDQPRTRQVSGRYLSVEYPAETYAGEPVTVQETVVPGRSPQSAPDTEPAPSPQAPTTEAEPAPDTEPAPSPQAPTTEAEPAPDTEPAPSPQAPATEAEPVPDARPVLVPQAPVAEAASVPDAEPVPSLPEDTEPTPPPPAEEEEEEEEEELDLEALLGL